MMNDKITVRVAVPPDLQFLALLVAGEPLWQRYGCRADRLSGDIAEGMEAGDLVVVAECGGRVEGLAWYQRGGGFGRAAYLRFISVSVEARGRGLGARLLAAGELRLARRGIPALMLLVSDFNQDAQRFYQRQGYKRIGTIPEFVLPGVDELIYWKKLG